jgi:hypothetical protein
MIDCRLFVAALFCGLFFCPFPAAQAQNPLSSPVLIELYTAENCPYCPPADELLARLSGIPGIVAVACHVDYFGEGRLQLPRPFCRDRQQYYVGRQLARRIYTPMMILNGRYEAIGYQGDKVSAALMKARGDGIAPITVQKGEGLMFNISLPAIQTNGAEVSLWMMMVDKPHTGLALPSRNNGQPITYVNAAGLYQTLGKWDGSAQVKSQALMIGGIRKGIVIAAQDDATGEILAVGKYDFQ